MGGETQEAAQRTRYLLGGGSEAERERFEAQYFADENAFQEMLSAEDDLIDAYARGELSANERRQFEKRFLTSSEGRERVQFARAFAASRPVVTPVVSTKTWPGFFASTVHLRTAFRAAMAIVAVASMIGFSWLLVQRQRMNTELRDLRAERERLNQRAEELQRIADAERARTAEATAQLNSVKEQTPSTGQREYKARDPQQIKSLPDTQLPEKWSARRADAAVGIDPKEQSPSQVSVQFDLSSGSVRGGSGNTFEVPRNTKLIRLRVSVDSETLRESYRAAIETPEGRTVTRVNSVKTNDGTYLVIVPAKDLPPGDYILFLSEKRANDVFVNVANYSFRLVRK